MPPTEYWPDNVQKHVPPSHIKDNGTLPAPTAYPCPQLNIDLIMPRSMCRPLISQTMGPPLPQLLIRAPNWIMTWSPLPQLLLSVPPTEYWPDNAQEHVPPSHITDHGTPTVSLATVNTTLQETWKKQRVQMYSTLDFLENQQMSITILVVQYDIHLVYNTVA